MQKNIYKLLESVKTRQHSALVLVVCCRLSLLKKVLVSASSFQQKTKFRRPRCLGIVNTNTSLNAANDSKKKYHTFPDSEIVRIYMKKAGKIKCMMQFIVAPVMRDITFHLDETITC